MKTIELPIPELAVFESESGGLLFQLIGSDTPPLSSYDLLAVVARAEDEDYAKKLLYLIDVYEANMPIKDTTYWIIRDCVRVEMTLWSDKRRCKTYLMKDPKTGLIKIGHSIRPKRRRVQLNCSVPGITILKVCDKDIEAKLHKAYSKKRVKGEWFRLTEEDIQEIITSYNFHDYE